MRKGLIVVVSGFSGAGKGTLMKRLVADYDQYELNISATTRKPREGEVDGREYHFVTKECFKKMIENDELMEYAEYVEHSYGSPTAYVMEKINEGKDVLLEIELQGALQIKKKFPEALLVFITPPDAKTLKERLIGRGTETIEQIEKRLHRAVEEARSMDAYDYIVVNDDLDQTVKSLHQLIEAQHFDIRYNKELIQNIQDDMEREYSRGKN
ncbi:MAG: guanylate kinase [Lachnospiraceae bacterium]|jgi:hypothetical protein|nr:guanylate kinase [Lachnospiraceae bacterium]